MPYDDIVLEAEDKMEKALAVLGDELKGVRTGRASAALVDGIKVKPFDAGAIDAIVKAIQKSDVGLTPQSDGKIVRLGVPPLSEERRKQMAKHVKEQGEKAKVSIRNIRRDGNQQADAEEKKGDISEDELKRTKEEVDRLTKEYEGKVQEAVDKKTKEVMEV